MGTAPSLLRRPKLSLRGRAGILLYPAVSVEPFIPAGGSAVGSLLGESQSFIDGAGFIAVALAAVILRFWPDLNKGKLPKSTEFRRDDLPWAEFCFPSGGDSDGDESWNSKLLREERVD